MTHNITHLNWENFIAKFRPVINPRSTYEADDYRRFCFSKNDESFLNAAASSPEKIWTLYEDPDNGIVQWASEGIGVVNRGYFICDVTGPDDNFIMVHDDEYSFFKGKFILTMNDLSLDEDEFEDEFNSEFDEWRSNCRLPVLDLTTSFNFQNKTTIKTVVIDVEMLIDVDNPSEELLNEIKNDFKSYFYPQCKNLGFISTYHFEPGATRSYF